MSVALIQGIPRRARVRVEALPERTLVWKGVASSSLSLELDPGKYIYKVHKNIAKKRFMGFCNQFLHELTEEQFEKLQDVSPKLATFRITSDGPTYICGYAGCGETTTSGTSMVMHELEHQGLTLQKVLDDMGTDDIAIAIKEGHESAVRKEPERVKPTGDTAVIKADDSYVSPRQGQKRAEAALKAKRKPGRPRKEETPTDAA